MFPVNSDKIRNLSLSFSSEALVTDESNYNLSLIPNVLLGKRYQEMGGGEEHEANQMDR